MTGSPHFRRARLGRGVRHPAACRAYPLRSLSPASAGARTSPQPPHRGSSGVVVVDPFRSWSLAQPAPSPAGAAAAATPATTAGTHCAASAGSAGSAATAPSANNDGGQLHVAANDFLIEEMERGETDVRHFLFSQNEALIGQAVVRLRDIGSGYGCGCAPRQRKTQSGGTQRRNGGGFGFALLLRSLLHP